MQYDAYQLALEATTQVEELTEDEAAAEVVPQQTQGGDVLFFVFEAKGEATQVFTAENIAVLKEIHDTLVGNEQFEDFCLREDVSEVSGGPGGETDGTTPVGDCQPPLAPHDIFYGSVEITDDAVDYDAFVEVENFDDIVRTTELVVVTMLRETGTVDQFQVLSEVQAAFPGQDDDVLRVLTVYASMQQLATTLDGSSSEQRNVDNVLKLMKHMLRIPSLGRFIFFFDKNFLETGESRFTRAIYSFGLPLEGYNNREDRAAEQSEKLAKWFQDDLRAFLINKSENSPLDVLYFATPLVADEFLLIIVFDMLLAVGSMIVVFAWLWYQTESVTVAIAAMTEILLSLPLALFVYRLVLGLEYISGLVAMCLYIVLAIGADDVFVFMDAYKQSLYQGPEVTGSFQTRMLWTYRRAAGAMLITSFTTACAFFATALSPLAEVASFGIFAALCIIFDYLLVITWLPAIVVYYHNNWELKPNCCCACCHPKGCSGLCAKQPVTTTEQLGGGAGEVELVVTGDDARAGDDEEAGGASSAAAEPAPVKKRVLEHFFEGKFADFIINKKSRTGIFIFFALLLIPVIYFDAQAEEATSADEFFPEDHPFQRIFSAINSEFSASSEDRNAVAMIVWGVEGVDRDGVSPLVDPSNLGSVIWDEEFAWTPAMQTHVVDTCERARLADFVGRDKENPALGAVVCFAETWRDWVVGNGDEWPVPASEADDSLVAWLEADVNPDFPGTTNFALFDKYVGVDATGVRWVAIEADTQLLERSFSTEAEIRGHYDAFEEFVAEVNAGAPAAAFQTALGQPGRWVWMHTQSIYLTSAITGASFGAFLAFAVLLGATRNIVVALLSMLTIAGILASVLATMTMIGWQLGNIVSINLTILGGFAVDYVVHLAHSFMHNRGTREERVRAALADMGVSVLSGMITSVGASLMLFATTLQFFAKFGGFLLMTVAFSWVWANFFFMSLMATVGPEGGERWLGLKAGPKTTSPSS